MKVLLIPIFYVLSVILCYIEIKIDLLFNGEWLSSIAKTSWQWYNYFTSPHHALTILYINHGAWWLCVPILITTIIIALLLILKYN